MCGTTLGDLRDYHRDPFPHSLLSTRTLNPKPLNQGVTSVIVSMAHLPNPSSSVRVARPSAPQQTPTPKIPGGPSITQFQGLGFRV